MENRKKAHIELAFQSRTESMEADGRFDYEPFWGDHLPVAVGKTFFGKEMALPIWVSSMTGGTQLSRQVNHHLAQACAEFGMGMGLGSCRILLDSPQYFPDFDVRAVIGNQPLLANLGICQLEQLIDQKATGKIDDLMGRLDADGLIIHINPLQEAFQPEGDRLKRSPLEILEEYLQNTPHKLVVKEVGQGFGPQSMRKLLQMPFEAIEFGALGGTNFTLVELHRQVGLQPELFFPFSKIGHTAEQMVQLVNHQKQELGDAVQVDAIIISGGITNVLDGYYLTEIAEMPAIFGMGSAFLKHALHGYAALHNYVASLEKGWQLAHQFLKVRKTH